MADERNPNLRGTETGSKVEPGGSPIDAKVGHEYLLSQQTSQTAPAPIDLPESPMTEEDKRLAASRKAVTQSYWSLVKHQFKKNKVAVVGLYIVYTLVSIAILADFLANDKPIFASRNGTFYVPVIKD